MKYTKFTAMQVVKTLRIPTHIFNRFIMQFYDVTDFRLQPATHDVHQDKFTLYHKEIYIANVKFTFDITITTGANGLERIVSVTSEPTSNPSPITTSLITFPWIRMADILINMKEVIKETQQEGLL